jgi:molybdopterin/thiamine biosynthesis adenylyltransferase
VNIHNGEVTPLVVDGYSVVVITENYDPWFLTNLNEFCHRNGIGFIHAGVLGLYAHCFSDFGEEHTIYGKQGKMERNLIECIMKPKVARLEKIQSDKKIQLESDLHEMSIEMEVPKKKQKKFLDHACLNHPTVFL